MQWKRKKSACFCQKVLLGVDCGACRADASWLRIFSKAESRLCYL
jgi:hypothetical protein